MRRRALIAAGIVVFLAISFAIARFLSTEGRERSALVDLLTAQASGDAAAMLDLLDPACRADRRCRAVVEANADRLRREGTPKVISLRSDTAYALGEATGTTRVAWTVLDGGLPVVQCVEVRRGGSALAGRSVTLLTISVPIGNEASC